MHEAITEFKTECLKDGKEMISKYMHDIIVPGIKEKFLKFKNEEKKIAEGIIQIGTLSETLLDDIFTFIKYQVGILEKKLKSNDDSIIVSQQRGLHLR
jgi:hypothetical protein